MARTGEFYDQRLETMTPGERERYYNERLREVVRYAYEHAPGWKEKFDRAGVTPSQIDTVQDLVKIPITKKEELIELQRGNPPFGGLVTVAPNELKRIFVSTGPIYDPTPPRTYATSEKVFHTVGFRKGDIVINSLPYHLVPIGVAWDEAFNRLGITIIPAGPGNSELQTRIMYDLKVTGFIGMPSFLMTIIRRAEELGYNFKRDFSLRLAYLAGEMVPPSLRRIFEEEYGIETRDGYGMAEMGGVAQECRYRSGMHILEELVVEIVDPATGKQLGAGETGEVVMTHLDEVYPMIRLGTGDLSYYIDEPCPCGRTSHRLSRILGRVGEAVKVKGLFVHGKELEEALSLFPQVSRFQALVHQVGHRDELTLNIELGEEVDREKLLPGLHKAIQDTCRLRADRIEFVAQGTIPEEHKKVVDKRTWE
jgi:phenylacetate-CoA ligase